MPQDLRYGTRGIVATVLSHPTGLAAWCIVASFGTYACMYGFRKPFTAGTYSEEPFGPGFKTWLVTAQVLGYMASKFVGIRVIATMPPSRRAITLVVFVALAQLALFLFAVLPTPWNVACLFLNGLPLGMVFGLVLGFLEGRRLTEAFVAGLCASFIVADGFTKSVGLWLISIGITERWMPSVAGMLFLGPLILFVLMLNRIPPPGAEDVAARSERTPMTLLDRMRWLQRHGVALFLIAGAYLLITVLRSLRADFAPELWKELGVRGQPALFTYTELWVAAGAVLVNGSLSWVRDNRNAFLLSLALSSAGLLILPAAALLQYNSALGGMTFLILAGFGLYVPYVAVHTTIFERLIAMTRDRANAGYLMYLADAFGYLGYAGVMMGRHWIRPAGPLLEFFQLLAIGGATLALAAFAGAAWHFRRRYRVAIA